MLVPWLLMVIVLLPEIVVALVVMLMTLPLIVPPAFPEKVILRTMMLPPTVRNGFIVENVGASRKEPVRFGNCRSWPGAYLGLARSRCR